MKDNQTEWYVSNRSMVWAPDGTPAFRWLDHMRARLLNGIVAIGTEDEQALAREVQDQNLRWESGHITKEEWMEWREEFVARDQFRAVAEDCQETLVWCLNSWATFIEEQTNENQ